MKLEGNMDNENEAEVPKVSEAEPGIDWAADWAKFEDAADAKFNAQAANWTAPCPASPGLRSPNLNRDGSLAQMPEIKPKESDE